MGSEAYRRSKLALVLFTYELARRLQGSGVTANCLHPGAVRTKIWSNAGAFSPLFRLSSETSYDEALAKELWDVSLKVTGLATAPTAVPV